MDRNEAIEIVRDYYPSSGRDFNEALETLIPELKESNDESIRKGLLKAFQESEDSLYLVMTPQKRKSIISWLEKQGENKASLQRTLNFYKKSDKIATERMKGRLDGRDDVINNPEEYGLQKPAKWSEEDYARIDDLISLLEDTKPYLEKDNKFPDVRLSLVDEWLKSLKPPYYCNNCKLKKSVIRWKPSEEQLDILKRIADGWSLSDSEKMNINILRNDLKALCDNKEK